MPKVSHAGNADQCRIDGPALFLDHGRQRRERAHDALAERNDGEQAVALDDVMGMPGRAAVPVLSKDGTRQFDEHEGATQDQGHAKRKNQKDQSHPAELGDRDGYGIGQAGAASGGILPARAQPLEHHGGPHDHVAEHHHRIIEVPAVLNRGEQARQAEGKDQRADHLHHRDEPEDPVIGIIGRGEPGEIDPGPADGKARKAKADHGSGVMALRQRMGELGSREPEADDERQVKQQFERCRNAVDLVGIAPAHSRA
jgi:hypothetical protein